MVDHSYYTAFIDNDYAMYLSVTATEINKGVFLCTQHEPVNTSHVKPALQHTVRDQYSTINFEFVCNNQESILTVAPFNSSNH